MYGYIVPNILQKDITAIQKVNSKSKVTFTMETNSKPQTYQVNPTSYPDGRNRENNLEY